MSPPADRSLGWPDEQPVFSRGEISLRPWRSDDADAVFEACQDPEIQFWTTVPSPYRLDDAKNFVDMVAPGRWSSQRGASFCVTDADDAVLGNCAIVALDHPRLIGEIGYWVAPDARSRGVARNAVQALTDWAFDTGGLDRLELYIEPDNTPSIAMAERVGCEREGLLRSKAIVRGERRDMVLYSLVRGH